MKKLYADGLGMPLCKIARKLHLDESTVSYHLNERQRENTLARALKSLRKNKKKQPKSKQRIRWEREYYKERYRLDPEFRRGVIDANRGDILWKRGYFKKGSQVRAEKAVGRN